MISSKKRKVASNSGSIGTVEIENLSIPSPILTFATDHDEPDEVMLDDIADVDKSSSTSNADDDNSVLANEGKMTQQYSI